MFTKIKQQKKHDELLLQIDNDINVLLEIEHPPYFSRLFLKKNDIEITDISISSENTQNLQNQLKQIEELTPDLLIALLNNLNLNNFAEAIKKEITGESLPLN